MIRCFSFMAAIAAATLFKTVPCENALYAQQTPVLVFQRARNFGDTTDLNVSAHSNANGTVNVYPPGFDTDFDSDSDSADSDGEVYAAAGLNFGLYASSGPAENRWSQSSNAIEARKMSLEN